MTNLFLPQWDVTRKKEKESGAKRSDVKAEPANGPLLENCMKGWHMSSRTTPEKHGSNLIGPAKMIQL